MNRVLWVSVTVVVIAAGAVGWVIGDLTGYSSGHSAGYSSGYNDGYGQGTSDTLLPINSFVELAPGASDALVLNLGTGTFNVTLFYGFQVEVLLGPGGGTYSAELNFSLNPCPHYSTGWVNEPLGQQAHPSLQCTFTDLTWSITIQANPANSGPVIILTTTAWSISYRSLG